VAPARGTLRARARGSARAPSFIIPHLRAQGASAASLAATYFISERVARAEILK